MRALFHQLLILIIFCSFIPLFDYLSIIIFIFGTIPILFWIVILRLNDTTYLTPYTSTSTSKVWCSLTRSYNPITPTTRLMQFQQIKITFHFFPLSYFNNIIKKLFYNIIKYLNCRFKN